MRKCGNFKRWNDNRVYATNCKPAPAELLQELVCNFGGLIQYLIFLLELKYSSGTRGYADINRIKSKSIFLHVLRVNIYNCISAISEV